MQSRAEQCSMDENSSSSSSPLLPLHESSTSSSSSSTLKSVLTVKNLFILSGPLLCSLICLFVKLDGGNMLGVLAWVFVWWLTEAVPMPITSMSPLFLFPLFGIASSDDVARSYMDDVISLVLGSFILALAVEHYNIHRRLALNVMMATLLFIIPNKKQQGEKLMDWNKCKKLPWNIVLLLGAGLAIADGVRTSGVADVLARTLDFLGQTPYLAIAPVVCVISAFMTELITSNNATTTILVPLLIQIAKNMNVHPLLLMVPGAIGAQFAFLLPTATPSNVIGFTTGHIDVKDMLKTGLPLKLAGTLALAILMPTLGALVFVSLKTGQH